VPVGKPGTRACPLRKRERLCDGFLARADEVLRWTGNGAQGVDERPVPRFLSDDNVVSHRSRTSRQSVILQDVPSKRVPLGERRVVGGDVSEGRQVDCMSSQVGIQGLFLDSRKTSARDAM